MKHSDEGSNPSPGVMEKPDRQTKNSVFATREFKGPKWLAHLFHPDQNSGAARGFRGGFTSVYRIFQDLYEYYFVK